MAGSESVFYQLLRKLYPGRFESAKIIYPFLYLQLGRRLAARPEGRAAESLAPRARTGASEWRVLRHVRCAELDPDVFDALASSFQNRFRVLQALIRRTTLPRDRTGHLVGSPQHGGAGAAVTARPRTC